MFRADVPHVSKRNTTADLAIGDELLAVASYPYSPPRPKPNHQEWENQAIALLDEATRVLAASRSSCTRRQLRPSELSAAATDFSFEDRKEQGDGDAHRRQQQVRRFLTGEVFLYR